MNGAPLIFAGVVFAALVFIALKYWVRGGGLFPPHEFAYGAALPNSDAIPEMMDQFFSVDGLDNSKIQIKTYAGNQSENNLQPLIRYLSSLKDSDLEPLIADLRETDRLNDQRRKAVELVKTLLPYRDRVRNESQRDSIIVFVSYGLMCPSQLLPQLKGRISAIVRQLDTSKQSAAFGSGRCPENYLVGNVNVYPLDIENTSWHGTAEVGPSKEAPILEIRFMGLAGIFRYLLDEMTAKSGLSFEHLDGTSLETEKPVSA